MMKKYITVVAVALMCFMAVTPASAAFENQMVPSAITETEEGISPQEQDTAWYYRINNGVLEKRLWSYEDGCWLTDWMPA